MPPRHFTLPPAQTQAARDAMQAFYCQLCQKGYTRMNDYETHLSSYDHSHKQRLKDMKKMTRDPEATARARRQEAKADGVISIKLADAGISNSSGGTAGFKKSGFKKSGFKSAFVAVDTPDPTVNSKEAENKKVNTVNAGLRSELVESETEDEGYEVYDPRHPTD